MAYSELQRKFGTEQGLLPEEKSVPVLKVLLFFEGMNLLFWFQVVTS